MSYFMTVNDVSSSKDPNKKANMAAWFQKTHGHDEGGSWGKRLKHSIEFAGLVPLWGSSEERHHDEAVS